MKVNLKRKICVFCGASKGINPEYEKITFETGKIIGKLNYDLVFGGGSTGLMGALAKGALSKDSNVHGVIPKFLTKKEIPINNITLTKTNTISKRKLTMLNISSIFLVLPGGIGTLDELFEVLTLVQLKQINNKPTLILNVNNFWDPLLEIFNKLVEEGFLKENFVKNILVLKNLKHLESFLKSF